MANPPTWANTEQAKAWRRRIRHWQTKVKNATEAKEHAARQAKLAIEVEKQVQADPKAPSAEKLHAGYRVHGAKNRARCANENLKNTEAWLEDLLSDTPAASIIDIEDACCQALAQMHKTHPRLRNFHVYVSPKTMEARKYRDHQLDVLRLGNTRIRFYADGQTLPDTLTLVSERDTRARASILIPRNHDAEQTFEEAETYLLLRRRGMDPEAARQLAADTLTTQK